MSSETIYPAGRTERQQRAAWIRSELLLKGYLLKDVAAFFGVDRQVVSGVVNGRISSNRMRQKIADLVGIPYAELWDGPPRRRGRPFGWRKHKNTED